jgi:hypothetical protein
MVRNAGRGGDVAAGKARGTWQIPGTCWTVWKRSESSRPINGPAKWKTDRSALLVRSLIDHLNLESNTSLALSGGIRWLSSNAGGRQSAETKAATACGRNTDGRRTDPKTGVGSGEPTFQAGLRIGSQHAMLSVEHVASETGRACNSATRHPS